MIHCVQTIALPGLNPRYYYRMILWESSCFVVTTRSNIGPLPVRQTGEAVALAVEGLTMEIRI